MTAELPLAGLRVLDLGTRLSAPLAAGLLGELGAEVIKVERPDGGDLMRSLGPFKDGYSLWWAVEGRGRKSVTCDLRTAAGQDLLRRLAGHSDVLVENFRPGTMEGWQLGPDRLPDRLVYVRISAFGQTGRYADRPGVDRVAIAYGGLLHLTGEPDRPPLRPGVNVADYLTGVFAAQAATAALYQRDAAAGGRGQVIDAPLYGSVLRLLEWTVVGYDQLGVVRNRTGNRVESSAPGGHYPTADGAVVAIVAGSEPNFRRLCRALGRPELADDPRFSPLAARVANWRELDQIIEEWTRGLPAQEVWQRCVAAGVPAGPIYTAADLAADPHLADRGDLVTVADPVLGPVRQQAPFPRLANHPDRVPAGAPKLGEHNEAVWCGLVGLTADELAAARAAGVV